MTEAARPSRRQHQRYNVDVQVAVSVANEKLDARTRDMSRAGLCLVATQPIPRETEVSLELVLTFGDDGVSEPLRIGGRVAWCTALFGAYQIGVKFVKVDDERAKYLDMFVGFLDGTLAPGRDARRVRGRRPCAAARGRSRRSVRVLKVHATRTTSPSPEPPPTPTDRPSHVGRGPHRADRRSPRRRAISPRGAPASAPTARSRRGKRSSSACSWSSTTSRATRRRCGSRRASPGAPRPTTTATTPASASR